MRSIDQILRATTRCTITEDAPDKDENYYFEWKNAKKAAETFLKESIDELYDKIKHGDDEHQKWLLDKMNEFVNETTSN